eukprot:13117962-Alexandrium_andersonii.AAC.1
MRDHHVHETVSHDRPSRAGESKHDVLPEEFEGSGPQLLNRNRDYVEEKHPPEHQVEILGDRIPEPSQTAQKQPHRPKLRPLRRVPPDRLLVLQRSLEPADAGVLGLSVPVQELPDRIPQRRLAVPSPPHGEDPPDRHVDAWIWAPAFDAKQSQIDRAMGGRLRINTTGYGTSKGSKGVRRNRGRLTP